MEFGIFYNSMGEELLCLQDSEKDPSKIIITALIRKYLGQNIFNEIIDRALSLRCCI